jgi:hypothetical protein
VAAKLSPESDLTFEFLRPVPIEQTRITQVVKGIDFQQLDTVLVIAIGKTPPALDEHIEDY